MIKHEASLSLYEIIDKSISKIGNKICIEKNENATCQGMFTNNHSKVHAPHAYGCKHSKVDQTSVPIYESRGFLGKRPISSCKKLFKIDYFS